MNINTAICIFAYKRPDHLRRVVNALAVNAPAACLPLIVYVDGPRGVADKASVAETTRVAQQATGFFSVEVRSSPENLGLYRSLTSGISEVLLIYESIIVLEDDILTSPYFLQFMLDGLELYRDSNDVGSISGYTPPIKHELPETFFLRGADCWGWATWLDRWALYRHDAKAMAREIRDRGLAREFDLHGNYPYLNMLDGRAAGINNSWAICWHASCFLAVKLILYPGKSLVSNIGLYNSGEHCGPSTLMCTKIIDEHAVKVQSVFLMVAKQLFKIYVHLSCNRFRIFKTSHQYTYPHIECYSKFFFSNTLLSFKFEGHPSSYGATLMNLIIFCIISSPIRTTLCSVII